MGHISLSHLIENGKDAGDNMSSIVAPDVNGARYLFKSVSQARYIYSLSLLLFVN